MSLREPYPPPADGFEVLRLPCGRCIGCDVRKARDWAVRCCLEAAQHEETSFVTLTYDDDHLPADGKLDKGHLSGWLKRLRARLHPRRVRFFACGEYGETTERPHYHALLYGVRHDPSIQESWPFGFTRVDPCTPAAISYVAGYVGKKISDREHGPRFESWWAIRSSGQRVQPVEWRDDRITAWADEETGEVLHGPVEPIAYRVKRIQERGAPFRLMSRNPGIGGDSRALARHWRTSAIWRGREVPVPRYLHLAYKLAVSEEEYMELQQEKREQIAQRDMSVARLRAGEKIALSLRAIKADGRSL